MKDKSSKDSRMIMQFFRRYGKQHVVLQPKFLILKNALLFLCFLFPFLLTKPAAAQVKFFSPGWPADSMKSAVSQLYNYKFDAARVSISPLRKIAPQHPALQIFDCLEMYWKNFPIVMHPVQSEEYKTKLKASIKNVEALLEKQKEDPENMFYSLLLHIMLARQQYEDGDKWSAMQNTTDAYTYIKKGFLLQNKCSEYLLTSGLYNYYREFMAETNPVYKPMLSVFPAGNKKTGLAYLDKASVVTIFVKPEAMMFASYIYLRYEDKKADGLRYAEMMNKNYPDNYLFKVLYIENLIQSGEYEKAIPQLNKLLLSPVAFYKLPCALFKGMLEERFYNRPDEALKWYQHALTFGTPVNKANENYVGLAYYGMAGIYNTKGDKKKAKEYYKKAADYCQYATLKKQAKELSK